MGNGDNGEDSAGCVEGSALIRLSREAMGEVFRGHLPPSGSGGLAEAAGEG